LKNIFKQKKAGSSRYGQEIFLMTKTVAEIFQTDLETVEDMIKALLAMPKGYTLHPLGQKCAIGVDHIHECVYLDESSILESYVEGTLEDMQSTGEPTVIDIPEEDLATYTPELWTFAGFLDDGTREQYVPEAAGVFTSLAAAQRYGDRMIEAGKLTHYEAARADLDAEKGMEPEPVGQDSLELE
jgi:hypothetical protein